MSHDTLFASNSMAEHILRGALGIGALWLAITLAPTQPMASLALGMSALFAFRGCPVCWTIGLLQTARHAIRNRQVRPYD